MIKRRVFTHSAVIFYIKIKNPKVSPMTVSFGFYLLVEMAVIETAS